MSFLFSDSELSAIVRAATILLSPLDYDDGRKWQRDVCTAVQSVVDGDASAMADAAPCGVALCDRSGGILHLNAHLERALSADRDREILRNEISETARAAIALAKRPSIEATRRGASDVRTHCGRYTLSAGLLENERLGGRVCSIVFVDAQTARIVDSKAVASRYGLTRRETEIALLLQRGHSSKEIAAAIGISVNTVRRHMERVMAKFNVHTRLGVAAKLIE